MRSRGGETRPFIPLKAERFVHSQSCDPALHRICVELASRCTNIVIPLLRQEEVGECLREFYIAARAVLEKPKKIEEV